MSRRRFTKEFKLAAVRRLEAGESGSALARELEVKREKLYHWLAQVERYGVEGAFPGPGRRPNSSARLEPGSEHDRQLRQAIVRAALEHPACGARRTTHPVRRQKLSVHRKRVQRVMREENLLRRSRRRVPQTTDAKHQPRRDENLTREFRPAGSA